MAFTHSNHKCHKRCSCTVWPRDHRDFCTPDISMAHFRIIVISAMLKMNISNTGTSKHIFLPKRGNELSGYTSALVLSEQRDSPLLSLRPECHLSLTVPGPEAAQSLINLCGRVRNIKSKNPQMSECTENESQCNTGSTRFKVRQVEMDCKALDSLIRLGA